MTDPMREALEAERAELMAKNEAANGWGAAVGARLERIKEIDLALALTASAPGEPQPVAWRWRGVHSSGPFTYDETRPDDHPGYPTEPLYTSAPPAPGWDEAGVAGIDAAAEYLVQTVKRTLWDILRKDGRARDGGFEPFPHNPRQEDYRDVVREIVRRAAPSRPDAGCAVRVKPLEWIEREGVAGTFDASTSVGHYIASITDDGRGMWFIVGLTTSNYVPPDIANVKAAAQADYQQRIRSALAKPADAVNASVEARLMEALRAASNVRLGDPDTTIHSMPLMPLKVYGYDQIIEFANRRVHAALSAGGDEAKKSEGGVEGHARAQVDGCASEKGCISRSGEFTGNAIGLLNSPQPEAGIKPGPSEPTADVTDLTRVIYEALPSFNWDECEKAARAVHAFTVGRR